MCSDGLSARITHNRGTWRFANSCAQRFSTIIKSEVKTVRFLQAPVTVIIVPNHGIFKFSAGCRFVLDYIFFFSSNTCAGNQTTVRALLACLGPTYLFALTLSVMVCMIGLRLKWNGSEQTEKLIKHGYC